MASDPYIKATNDWSKRVNQAVGAGASMESVNAIRNMDMARVKLGYSPMSDQESIAAISAANGKPLQTDPANQSLNPLNTVPNDIRDIVTGITGSIVHPSRLLKTVENTPKALEGVAHGDFSQVGNSALGFIPGVSDVADVLQGKKGLRDLAQHPVGSLLDIAPLAGSASKLAMAGKLGKDLSAAGKVDEAAAVKNMSAKERIAAAQNHYKLHTGEKALFGIGKHAAAESLSKGRPIQALSRASGASQHIHMAAKYLGLSSDTAEIIGMRDRYVRGMWTQLHADGGKQATLDHLDKLFTEHDSLYVDSPYADEQLTPARKAEIKQIVESGYTPDLSWAVKLKNDTRIDDQTLHFIKEATTRGGMEAFYGWGAENKIFFQKTEDILAEFDRVPEATKASFLDRYKQVPLSTLLPWQDEHFLTEENPKALAAWHDKHRDDLQREFDPQIFAKVKDPKTANENYALGLPAELSGKLNDMLRSHGGAYHERLASAHALADQYAPKVNDATTKTQTVRQQIGTHPTHLPPEEAFQKVVEDFKAKFPNERVSSRIRTAKGEKFYQLWVGDRRVPLEASQLTNMMKHPNAGEPIYKTVQTKTESKDQHAKLLEQHRYKVTRAVENHERHVNAYAKDQARAHNLATDFKAKHHAKLAQSHAAVPRKSVMVNMPDHIYYAMYGKYGTRFFKPTAGQWDGYAAGMKTSSGAIRRKLPDRMSSKLPDHWAPYTRAMSIWRHAIFTTPRHLVHIGVGGLMQTLADIDYRHLTISNVRSAYQVAMGHKALPAVVEKHMSRFTGDELYNLATGKKVGDVLKAIPGAQERLQEHITVMYKALAYLTEHDKAIKAGLDDQAALEQGVKAAENVLVSTDKMTPIEKSLVRTVFPFYAFTKHLFQFLGRYPADHPLRAFIISKLAEQEIENWNSGLPYMWQQILFLGHPDQNGNVRAVDMRSINPFRSFFNDFTIAGITSSLNPAIGLGLKAVGVNALTGAPDLYPNMQVNPQTGALAVQPPGIMGAVQSIPSQFFPQLQGLEMLLPISDKYKNLKATDPQAFSSVMRSSFGTPFLPYTVNPDQTRARFAKNLFTQSQQTVARDVESGSFGNLNGYGVVPYKGQFVTPQSLEQLLAQYQATAKQQGLSLKDVIPSTKSRPSSYPTQLGG